MDSARFSSGDDPQTMIDTSEDNQVAKKPLMSEEDQRILFEKREQEELEKKKRQVRFENRKSFDELLLKLLNGDIFELFGQERNYFPAIPLKFEGHWQYLEIWEYMFTYEVFNMLLNSRRSD